MQNNKINCPICGLPSGRAEIKIKELELYGCTSCQFEFIHPQPSDEELSSIYGESYYHAWGMEKDYEDKDTVDMKKTTFNSYLDVLEGYKKEGRLLDVGCAMGYLMEAARARGFLPSGVEISAYSAGLAARKFKVHNGILEDSPFPDGEFDVVVMSDLLEHVRDPLRTLKKANSLLNPEGILMLILPDIKSVSHRLLRRKWSNYKPEHLHYFSRQAITKALSLTGFEVLSIKPAQKALNLKYIVHQYRSHYSRLWTNFFNLLNFITPEGLCVKNYFFGIGELFALAKKIA